MPHPDPFAALPDAQRSDFNIRTRAWAKPEKTCDLTGKAPKRKRVDLNPKQREWFTKNGWTFARVEAQNAWGGMTSDLWGVADYLACRPPSEIVLVQVTTATNAAARERKARKCPELQVWLAAGGRFEVHAWSQPGGPNTRWEMAIRPVTLAGAAGGPTR